MLPFFLDGVAGKVFCVYFEPEGLKLDGNAVIICQPFAEEMNKSRRMVSLLARSLAKKGIGTLNIDYYGTGDSAGDFSDARVSIWIEDLKNAISWLKVRGIKTASILSIRFGALLATRLLKEPDLALPIKKIIMWQPVISGKQYLNQFLRLRMAADLVASDTEKVTTKDLRQQLESGMQVEIAGYILHPDLTQEIDNMNFDIENLPNDITINWCNISAGEDRPVSPIIKKTIDDGTQNGINIELTSIVGESFWATPEISALPELIDFSVCQIINSES